MSVFKKINTQDFYLTDYVARKSWRLLDQQVLEEGVEVLYGVSGSTPSLYVTSSRDPEVVWKSVKHNYYGKDSPFLSDSSLLPERILNSDVAIFALPRTLYGTHLEPGTLQIGPSVSGSLSLYVEEEYVVDGYMDLDEGESSYLDYTVWEDGKGFLRNIETGEIKGDLIPNRGVAIIRDPAVANYLYTNSGSLEMKWKSNYPLYTLNINCRVRNSEMNHTFNPSSLNSDWEKKDNITGEEFTPYITTVGLYNEQGELLMVGKMNRPVRKSKDMDMVFKISLDI